MNLIQDEKLEEGLETVCDVLNELSREKNGICYVSWYFM